MSSRPVALRKSEIQRAVKILTETGLVITRVEIDGSKLTIHTSNENEQRESPLMEWRRRHGKS